SHLCTSHPAQQSSPTRRSSDLILAAVDAKRNPHYYNLDNNPWGGGYERTPEIRKAQSERAQRKKRQRQIDLLLAGVVITPKMPRSEEHTSELQSRENLVCRLLL